MTTIEWGDYNRTGGKTGGRLLLDNKTTNVIIDTVDIVVRNPSYFNALRDRNKKRLAILKRPERIKELETQIKAFNDAKRQLSEMLAHEGDFTADRHEIRETFGLDKGIES